MRAIRTRYDGRKIRITRDIERLQPCDVIVLFEEDESDIDADWLKMQEKSLAKAWDDKEDAVYDQV
ncbi:MAG: hypothetical protein KAV00_07465 [Phycisphaerae bacterium]|nr:hypothetical protein [Phycisphaerae bacterium]